MIQMILMILLANEMAASACAQGRIHSRLEVKLRELLHKCTHILPWLPCSYHCKSGHYQSDGRICKTSCSDSLCFFITVCAKEVLARLAKSATLWCQPQWRGQLHHRWWIRTAQGEHKAQHRANMSIGLKQLKTLTRSFQCAGFLLLARFIRI